MDFTITRCSFINSMFSSTRDMSVEYWKSGLSHFVGRVLPWSRIASVEKHSEGLSTMHPCEMPQSNNGLCWGSFISCFDCSDLRKTKRMAGHSLVFTPRLLLTIYKICLAICVSYVLIPWQIQGGSRPKKLEETGSPAAGFLVVSWRPSRRSRFRGRKRTGCWNQGVNGWTSGNETRSKYQTSFSRYDTLQQARKEL